MVYQLILLSILNPFFSDKININVVKSKINKSESRILVLENTELGCVIKICAYPSHTYKH